VPRRKKSWYAKKRFVNKIEKFKLFFFSSTIGQQMTPDTAKIKCKNFLATLLRLASDQPEGVARNVRALIQVCTYILPSFSPPSSSQLEEFY